MDFSPTRRALVKSVKAFSGAAAILSLSTAAPGLLARAATRGKRRIWIDCDPGWDDAIALIAASSKASGIEITGISTVFGNVDVNTATANALTLLHAFAPPGIPVFQGSAFPLTPPPVLPSWVGDRQPDLSFPGRTNSEPSLADGSAETAMKAAIEENPGSLTLLVLGPLTNIARLIETYPQVVTQIEDIIILGGSLEGGNVSPHAEFNFYMDAKAADLVLASSAPKTILPLDVAEAAAIPQWFFKDLRTSTSARRNAVARILADFEALYSQSIAKDDVSAYDAVALMLTIAPELFQTRLGVFSVDYEDAATFGRFVESATDDDPSSRIVTAIDAPALYRALLDIL